MIILNLIQEIHEMVRNGSYEGTLHTEFGELHLVILRDRNGDFKRLSSICFKRV